MIRLFDYFDHPEPPNIFLCNPNGDALYSISQFVQDDLLSLRFNALSEFKFKIPSSIDNGDTTLGFYEFVQPKRLVLIENVGYFLIYLSTEETGGEIPYKNVECRSIDSELISKKISSFSKTIKFYDPLHVTENLMDTILAMIPSWSIAYVDSITEQKYRTFNITDSTIYTFLMTDVEKAFQCVFYFDIENKTISVYDVSNATSSTDIFLSYDNLINNSEFKEISDEISTALSVYGGNGLTIRSVNPLGGNIIYDFSYYKTSNWMSPELIIALTSWENDVLAAQPGYAILLTDLKTANAELLDLNLNPSTGLQKLETDLLMGEAEQQIAVTTVPIDPVDVAYWAAYIEAKNIEIENKLEEISIKEDEISDIVLQIGNINSNLSFSQNFTQSELEELSLFTFQNTYTNENIITTSLMTEVEKQDAAQTLYDQALIVLAKASRPRYEFNVGTSNFTMLKEFQSFTNELELGSLVTIQLANEELISTILLEMETSFNDPNIFKLSFSNRLRLDNGNFQYSDILGQAQSTGNTVTTNSLVWQDWATNYRDDVSTFITSSLNATVNNIVNGDDQEMVMNNYGLRGRKQVSPGNYSDNQMWLTNDVLAFTDDNWDTAKLALGRITTPGGVKYGIIADTIVGRMLAGNSLTITNDDGINVKTFTLDQNGAILTNANFTIQNNYSKILLNPTNGIAIQKNTGTVPSPVWSNVFYVDGSGNAFFNGGGTFSGNLSAAGGTFSGALSAATGTFNGSITASSGKIGSWDIGTNGLKSANTENGFEYYPGTTQEAIFFMRNAVEIVGSPSSLTAFCNFSCDSVTFGCNSVYVGLESAGGNVDTFSINTDELKINGEFGISGTFSGLVFVNGILVGS